MSQRKVRGWPRSPGRSPGAGLLCAELLHRGRLQAGERSDELSWLIRIHTNRERKLPRSTAEAAERGMNNGSGTLPLPALSRQLLN